MSREAGDVTCDMPVSTAVTTLGRSFPRLSPRCIFALHHRKFRVLLQIFGACAGLLIERLGSRTRLTSRQKPIHGSMQDGCLK